MLSGGPRKYTCRNIIIPEQLQVKSSMNRWSESGVIGNWWSPLVPLPGIPGRGEVRGLFFQSGRMELSKVSGRYEYLSDDGPLLTTKRIPSP